MASEQRWMKWHGPLALWLLLGALVCLAPLRVHAQGSPDAGSSAVDAGTSLAPQEVGIQRTDGGFALEGLGPSDAGAAPRLVPPTLVRDSPAKYPEALAGERVAGVVRLELLVDEQGEVAEVVLVQGTHPLLDAAALHAASSLRFTPARVDGQPVPVRLNFEYRFEAPPPPAPTALPPVTLRGLVRTKGTRRPIIGAILLSQRDKEHPVETGPDGRFEARLPPGRHQVRVTAPGHVPGIFQEVVRKGETLEVVYGLEPLIINPYETVVRGDRERTEVSRVTLHDAELREVAGTQGDPFRVVMLLPGVSSMLSGVSYPVVRGTQPASTGYYLDGIRVPILFHLFLGPAVIHPDFIDTIDFFPGNPPTRYGRLMGGAVEGRLTQPRDDEERLHGSAYADFINAGLFLEYPFTATGTDVSVAGRVSYTAWLIGLAASTAGADAQDTRVVLDFYDYQARVEQKVGPGRLRLFVFGSSDTFGTEATGPLGLAAKQSVLFHRADARYRHPVGGGELEAGVTWGLDRFAISSQQPGVGGATFNVDQRTLSARLGYEKRFEEGITLRAGADIDRKSALLELITRIPLPPTDTFTETRLELPVALATYSGVWTELVWEKDSPWTLVPGIRIDNYHLSGGINHFVVEPRLTVRRPLDERFTFKGGVGLYHQSPTTLISLPIVDIAGLSLGLQQSLQVSAGAEWKAPLDFEVSVEGYFNPLLRTVELVPFNTEPPAVEQPTEPNPDPRSSPPRVKARQQLPDVPDVPENLPSLQSNGLAYGLEVLLRRPLGGNWFGWLSYSLQRSTRHIRFNRYDGSGRKVGVDEKYLPYTFDQTHVLNFVLNYKFANNITVGGVVHFNTGRPEEGNLTSRTQVPGVVKGEPGWVPVSRDQVDRLPPFFRVDLRVAKAWTYETFSMEAYLDILNASISQEVVGFNYSGGSGFPLEKEPIGIPLVLPVLGLKGRY
jgi:TonB family protein